MVNIATFKVEKVVRVATFQVEKVADVLYSYNDEMLKELACNVSQLNI